MNSIIPLPRLWRTFLFFLLLASARGQDDDFNDGNDTGWTRFAPLGALGGTSYSVSGGTYRLACNASPNATSYGPARCGSLRADRLYSTFCTTVDIVDYNPGEDTAMGILARIQPDPAPGAVNGYAFTFQGKTNDVEINRVTGEAPSNLSGSPDVTLQPGHSYRMVFFGIGTHLEGRIYDGSDLTNPLVTAQGSDDTYAEGMCGLLIFSSSNTRASAAFDNYSAGDGKLPPPAITALNGTDVSVSWETSRGLCHTLETSTDLMSWMAADGLTYSGGRTIYSATITPAVPARFFRLRLGLPAG